VKLVTITNEFAIVIEVTRLSCKWSCDYNTIKFVLCGPVPI